MTCATVAVLLAGTVGLTADTDNLPPGYSIRRIGSGASVSSISQLAFKPGDLTHLYAARAQAGKISRYDFDPASGELSNEVPVVSIAGRTVVGLGFHSTNLYVSSFNNGFRDDRIARFMDVDGNGLYETRHDFVYGIPTGDHNANQIQIRGDSLYVGIGGAGRKGDPAEENLYTLTIARIVDLNQVITTNIGADYKGPINYLASTNGLNEWTNTAGTDGQLRYFASGFRNPFGIAFDPQGELWVSVNGNSDAGFFSDDLLYKKVHLGDEGEFPPPEFGFAKYIHGNPITNFVDFGVSPSPAGFDFILDGPDAGKLILGELGATRTNSLGRDLLLIDPDTGSYQQIYQFSTNSSTYAITDVVRDPYGRFVVSDYGHDEVWLLTPPLPKPALVARRIEDHVGLSWPLTGVEFELEETPDPGEPGSWTACLAPIQLTPNGIQAEVGATNTTQAFRLRKN